MRALAWLMVVAALPAADARTVHGVVVDAQGAPIADVCIDHYGGVYCNAKTDALGTFRIETSAPAVVFRKPNYEPERVKLDRDDLRVEMRASSLQAPVCAQRCSNGWRGLLCFPEVKGVKVSESRWDVDYVNTGYLARVGKNKGFINHGQGSSWSLGLPSDKDVWDSTEYAERDFITPWGGLLVDARGKKVDSTVWRYMGIVSESASYDGVDAPEVAALLDRVLDGFCFANK